MTINLIHEAMRTAKADVAHASTELHAGRTAADRAVSEFLGSGWTGVAADAFAEAWDDWLVAADEVKAGLDSMELLLDAFHRDLTQQDDASQLALDTLSQRIVDRLG
ncbi:MAG: WXG100 family type VII secretion target [Nocardioides sp.]|jgi:WXG100 family type VII secretion target